MAFRSGWIISLLPLLWATSVPRVALAGKLDDAGRATRHSPSSHVSSSDRDDEDDGDEDDDGSSDCDEDCAELVAEVLLLPWSLPRALLASNRQVELWYDDYPYAKRSGYVGVRYEPLPAAMGAVAAEPQEGPEAGAQRWAGQARVEGGANLDGVGRAGAVVRVLMPVPIELEAAWLGFVERDGSTTDWAQLSGLRLNWRFAESRTVQFRTSLGYQHWFEDEEPLSGQPLTDEQRSQPGADLGYGFDAFVGKPFVLAAEGRLGVLGQALTWQARATLGAMFGPVEWYAGYDEVNIGGVSLGGPVTGLRGFL